MKNQIVLFGVLCVLFLACHCRPHPPPHLNVFPNSKFKARELIETKTEYTVKYYDQTIDHFTYTSKQTFKMRYLENLNYWNKTEKGPIFFYCGNEADITLFYENSGFLTKVLGPEFNALILFAEHRYFGESMPFGNQSESYKKGNNAYLTVEQALADYVEFLKWYVQEIDCVDCPIIAFGGSYGGMLAAWIRMKFPNVVTAAIASSAPILYFKDVTPLNIFYSISTYNFQRSNVTNCKDTIHEAYQRLDKYVQSSSTTQENLELISKQFNLCKNLSTPSQLYDLEDWLTTGYTYMAMTDYPYETNFLKHMPAWPCNESCQKLASALKKDPSTLSDSELFAMIQESIRVYYDYDNKTTCNDIYDSSSSSNDDMSGWNILACNSMAMPMEADGVHDMFSPRKFNYTAYSESCFQTYGQYPRYDWAIDFFGGKNDLELKQYSRIFFANGKLDPWSGGSPTRSLSKDVIAYYMDDSAHHLDLREPNPNDPQDVIIGRNIEKLWIQKWIKEYQFFQGVN